MTVQSRLRRLETLEQNCAPVLSLKERKERLRATLASVGINYLGEFPNIDKPADPTDQRTPAEKLRDFLDARGA